MEIKVISNRLDFDFESRVGPINDGTFRCINPLSLRLSKNVRYAKVQISNQKDDELEKRKRKCETWRSYFTFRPSHQCARPKRMKGEKHGPCVLQIQIATVHTHIQRAHYRWQAARKRKDATQGNLLLDIPYHKQLPTHLLPLIVNIIVSQSAASSLTCLASHKKMEGSYITEQWRK